MDTRGGTRSQSVLGWSADTPDQIKVAQAGKKNGGIAANNLIKQYTKMHQIIFNHQNIRYVTLTSLEYPHCSLSRCIKPALLMNSFDFLK